MAEKSKQEESMDTPPVGVVYLKGASVENGVVDLSRTVEYLTGLEKALKFYIDREDVSVKKGNYNVQVKLRPGSLITDIIDLTSNHGLLGIAAVAGIAVVSVGAGAYLKSAMGELGKNDVGDKSTKEIVGNAVSKMSTTLRIALHRGSMMIGKTLKPEETKVISAEEIILINKKGEELKVTKEELDTYRDTPKYKFREMMSLVDVNTKMYIGDSTIDPDNIPSDTLLITYKDKPVFDDRDIKQDDTLIFPELLQGAEVELEGELTRGNGKTNTLGFSYSGRILKCVLYNEDVKSVRNMLFGYVKITAVVERRPTAKNVTGVLKKPYLRIKTIESISDNEDDNLAQPTLFD